MKSRANAASSWSLTVPMKLADSVLLTTTTDRPMVSAAAVAAVRTGVREQRVRGQPPAGRERPCAAARASTRTSGMITNGASSAMPSEHRHRQR